MAVSQEHHTRSVVTFVHGGGRNLTGKAREGGGRREAGMRDRRSPPFGGMRAGWGILKLSRRGIQGRTA